MKFRLDFVTNSSSSSYIFRLSLVDNDNNELVVKEGKGESGDYRNFKKGSDPIITRDEFHKLSFILKNKLENQFNDMYGKKIKYKDLKYIVYSRTGYGDGEGKYCEKDFINYETHQEVAINGKDSIITLDSETAELFDNFLNESFDYGMTSLCSIVNKDGNIKTIYGCDKKIEVNELINIYEENNK